jgi:Putative DNA-binding domain
LQFANSAGGQLVYGIEEDGHQPTRVQDVDGVDSATIPREWIEQVIDSNIQPRIEGLHIARIEVAPDHVAYVITVPQATTYAPHMAADNRYYYRQNFQSVPMEDYQVRDALRRATQAEPYLEFRLAESNVSWPEAGTHSGTVQIIPTLGNKSRQPAFYTLINLFLDTAFILNSHGGFMSVKEVTTPNGNTMRQISRIIAIPDHMPVFLESPYEMLHPPLLISFPWEHQHQELCFSCGYSVSTPGYRYEKSGTLLLIRNRLTLAL